MFLALREIKRNKKHFGLITAVIALVGIMVFFLTGLAFGLNSFMTQAVTSLGADNIALAKNANDVVQASIIPTTDADKVEADQVSEIGMGALTIDKAEDEQVTAFAFAMNPDSFTAPNITEGQMYSTSGEVVADDSLKNDGYKLGDTFKTTQSDLEFKIVGFTHNKTYSASPVVYMELNDWRTTGVQYRDAVTAVATKGAVNDTTITDAKLKNQTEADFVAGIPGVSAQNITFGLMIGALIIVSAVILGVFIYVLTLQKRHMFGVMKAQGIGNATIGWSVIWQTALLSIFGSIIAVLIVLGVSAFMPAAVPFTIPWLLFAAIGAVMVLFSLIGAIFSVISATRIDPLIAIK